MKEASADHQTKVLVDLNKCQGYAQCCFLAPNTFELHGNEVISYNPAPAVIDRTRVLRAAASCPVQAITVEDHGAAK